MSVDAAGRVYYTNDSGLSIIPVSNCGSFCNLEGLPTAGFPAQAITGLALDPAGDIDDPIGGDISLYQELAVHLQGLIEKRLSEKDLLQAV